MNYLMLLVFLGVILTGTSQAKEISLIETYNEASGTEEKVVFNQDEDRLTEEENPQEDNFADMDQIVQYDPPILTGLQ